MTIPNTRQVWKMPLYQWKLKVRDGKATGPLGLESLFGKSFPEMIRYGLKHESSRIFVYSSRRYEIFVEKRQVSVFACHRYATRIHIAYLRHATTKYSIKIYKQLPLTGQCTGQVILKTKWLGLRSWIPNFFGIGTKLPTSAEVQDGNFSKLLRLGYKFGRIHVW